MKGNDKMKIAMIGHKRVPSREGGVEIVVEELSTRMVKNGHEVDIYNRSGCDIMNNEKKYKQYKKYKGCKLITIPTVKWKKLNAIVYSLNATLRAAIGRYDVIHYHAEGPCATLPIAKLFGIKTVATIHGLDWQRSKWGGFATKFLKFGEKMAAKYADDIVVLSKNVQLYFLKTYNRETTYIPNGINKPKYENDKIINNKYGIEKDEYILYLARIVPEKGLHYLVEAYNNLITDKKLVIAGGSSHTDEYFEKIKNMASNNSNIIMTGFVDGKLLDSLYNNAYIYVLPSDIEGMPISLLEAMSYNNCCLTSDIPEMKEVIEENGITFQKSNITDLKNKIQFLCDNKDIVDAYKKEASDFIINKYNWDKIVDNTLDQYMKVIGYSEIEKNNIEIVEN